jgi:hypothetical protein
MSNDIDYGTVLNDFRELFDEEEIPFETILHDSYYKYHPKPLPVFRLLMVQPNTKDTPHLLIFPDCVTKTKEKCKCCVLS